MNPPAGRIQVGDPVVLPDGRRGTTAAERLIQSNGAWSYRVTLEDGSTVELLDYELKKT
jgi:hypothetical protein